MNQIYQMLNAHTSALPSEPLDEQTVSAIMRRFRTVLHPSIHTPQRRSKAVLFTLIAAAAMTGTAFAADSPLAKYAEQPPVYDADGNPVPHEYVTYEVNDNGQTYGSPVTSPDSMVYLEDYPELMRVQGDHGITGYVYTAEWLADDIHTPEEACAYMEAMYKSLAMGTYQPKSYTVYAADGKTAVDTFTVRADSGMIAHVKEIYDENGNLREGRESPWAEPLPRSVQ